jgi:beta-glucosidase
MERQYGEIDDLVRELTLEEKAKLVVGRDFWTTEPIERLDIPSVWVSDGPTGLRKPAVSTSIGMADDTLPATCFPTESALAASWDTDLVRAVGRAIGEECAANDVHVLLGPGVNLKRSPLCGRNFEYFSEDPILSGELAVAFVDGVQSVGVGTSVKHFAGNEQETARFTIDSQIDERPLRELYLRPFEIAVHRAAPWTLMAAYNLLNGEHCTENRTLLHDIARDDWGFDGIIVSDWGGVTDIVGAIDAGLNLEMPHARNSDLIVRAVNEGRLAEERLDEAVRPLLRFIFNAVAQHRSNVRADLESHHALARRAAAESAVLLKNAGDILPLSPDAGIAVIGAFAREPRFQGGGSSHVHPVRVDTAFDTLQSFMREPIAYATGYGPEGAYDEALQAEAVQVAAASRVALLFVGLPDSYENEGRDRFDIDLPASHNALIEAVADVQPNTVVVLTNGAAVTMPWASRVAAILEGWLGGEAGGAAIADILVGDVTPSGKLSETFPARLIDTPTALSFPGDGLGTARYDEGLYIGYRWYDARDIEPLFPFGHGLSYTTFAYDNLTIDRESFTEGETLTVTVEVRNTGTRRGAEVVQLYVHEHSPRLPRPHKELRAFARVALEPGESRTVPLTLTGASFAYWEPRSHRWEITPGTFDLLVGSSSRDIRLSTAVHVTPAEPFIPPVGPTSLVGEWITHPVAGPLLRPLLEERARAHAEETGEVADLSHYIFGMPIQKLVDWGALTEEQLAGLVAAAQSGELVPQG